MHVIVVLGAQNDAAGVLSPMALARARGTLEQYRRLPGAKLVVTGGYGHFNPAPQPHAHYMAAYLIEHGVDPGDILARVESAHTVEDAALTRCFLLKLVDSGRGDAPAAVTVKEPRIPVAAASLPHQSERRDGGSGHRDAPTVEIGASLPVCSIVVVTSEVHVPRAQLIFEHFFSPAQLAFVGTPDAVSAERLQELEIHEAEQIARICRQGGVIYGGKLERRRH